MKVKAASTLSDQYETAEVLRTVLVFSSEALSASVS
jgi:hypothetical protein